MVQNKKTKFIFVCGGVMSGVGKGITTASIGRVLEAHDYRVALMKADPYLNVDAGTMNPTEHGEVFVLDSGLETDQDMGNYERFLDRSLPAENYMTNGMVFKAVIDRERALGYNGKCVEPTYHITEEIIHRIDAAVIASEPDVMVIEIGGTVGEYQNAIFLEAARQIKLRHPRNVAFVMVSYLPTPKKIGEMKTKPTQNAVHQLNSFGIHPDIIVARAEYPVDQKRKEKIAHMSGLLPEQVISAPDVDSIYDVPLNFAQDGLGKQLLNILDLEPHTPDLANWEAFVQSVRDADQVIRIAMVGKYFDTGDFVLSDAYISVIEAIKGAAASLGLKAKMDWINAKEFDEDPSRVSRLGDYDAILVPGGFGKTGIEGKIAAIQYARENKIPYLGLCYGMQLLVIEYARNVAGIAGATSHEMDSEAEHLVIDIMPEQKQLIADGQMGGTMRLGSYPAKLEAGTLAEQAYGQSDIVERHRHRYEVNPEYVEQLTAAGLVFSGKSPDNKLMEIAELPIATHPFMVGAQFHPEFLARPLSPHPLFVAWLQVAKQGL